MTAPDRPAEPGRFACGPDRVAVLRFGTAADGDLAITLDPAQLEPRRAALAPLPWTWLRQVHGPRVVTVTQPGAGAGEEADAAVTDVVGATLAVHTADCAPVLLWGDGVVGAAHAGWRGLVAGVIEATVAAMEELGAGRISARLGPCISPGAYEFGQADLDEVAARYGDGVRAVTAAGAPALDLRSGVRAALGGVGVAVVGGEPPCTAGEAGYFSWRARRDAGRLAHTIHLAPATGPT